MNALTERERLELLARHLETFEAADFTFGAWVPSRTGENGVIHLGWFERSPAADAFLADAAAGGFIAPFDWMAWMKTPAGRKLASGPAAVAGASAEDLGRLLTAIVRSDRFSEGSLAGAYESGLLTAILRRAKELAASLG